MRFFSTPRAWAFRYRPLVKAQDGVLPLPGRPQVSLLLYCGCLVVVAATAFWAGQHHPTTAAAARSLSSAPEFSSVARLFHYNRTFADPPSAATDDAWHALFPPQGGFFRHPTVAPKRATFSVFHQLHCLDGIRHGYWALWDAASSASSSAESLDESKLPFHASPSHIRHCIDLLRNALMCQPDLTVEVKDMEKGGVTGFGTEHQCVDWGELVAWTSNWETWMQIGKVNKTKAGDRGGHGHGPGEAHAEKDGAEES